MLLLPFLRIDTLAVVSAGAVLVACENGVGYPILAEDTAGGGASGDGDAFLEGGDAGASGGCVPVPSGPFRDADADGIVDALDLDDDNDGSSDLEECFEGAARFQNPSFEEPVVSGLQFVQEALVPGWSTDDESGEMEFWADGFNDIPAMHGNQLIEVARGPQNTVSQSIVTIPGTTLRWAFYHRGRGGEETIRMSIGLPAELDAQGEMTTSTEWTMYEGTYEVPAGQTVTTFAFQALIPVEGFGNLVDLADAEPICIVDTDGDGCVDTEDPD